MIKVCHVVFSTNRIDYLKRTFDSHKNLNYDGVQVHKLFIDDYPSGRDNDKLTKLVKGYGFDEIVLHEKNLGITSTWEEMFKIVRDRGYDYILHQEDDVELLQPIKVTEMIDALKSNSRYSQIQLKRNAWYSYEDPNKLFSDTDVDFGKYKIELNESYFWMMFALYPAWISLIDFKEKTGSCPAEGVVSYHLNKEYKLNTGILKNADGTNIVNHFGDLTKGKRCNENEPGWERFKYADPNKVYNSRTGEEVNHVSSQI
jgi:hypothetical protein